MSARINTKDLVTTHTDPQLDAFIEAMNRDPSKYWPNVTCALIVKALRAAVEAGVIAGPEREEK